MKEINGKYLGECVLCGIVGQGSQDFICADCGAPDKLMLVCRCGRRDNLTTLRGESLRRYLKAIVSWNEKDEEDLNLGMTISTGSCTFCSGPKALEEEAGKDLRIYSVKNQGFNVGA